MNAKDELLEVPAFRVHDGDWTIMVTYLKDEVTWLFDRREKLFKQGNVSAAHTFVEEVSGGWEVAWREQIERLASDARYDGAGRIEVENGCNLNGSVLNEAYSMIDVSCRICFPVVRHLMGMGNLPVLRLIPFTHGHQG